MAKSSWDAYAPFYDWENARTFGRRDVAFWRTLARREGGPVLELGCGTGRILIPLARAGIAITGVDRSAAMLAKARVRGARLPKGARPRLLLGDVCALPFADASFAAVIAPYGLLQSLLTDRDLARALKEAARVVRPGGLVGVDLVPDLPSWREYKRREQLKGRGPRRSTVTLIESVRQDRRRGVTIFDEEFVERARGRTRRRRFTLTFRTVSVPRMVARLRRAGIEAHGRFGDYDGAPLAPGSDAWLIVGRKK